MYKLIHMAASEEKYNHSFLIIHLVLRMSTEHESNLPALYKWMHEFTQQEEKRAINYNHTLALQF